MSRPDLSTEAKQTFQVVSLFATILVVGIHYKSAYPETPDFQAADWNQLIQEFWFGGLARVAVPLFAFAAGLFYFRSDDGTVASYREKTKQRFHTVLVPYLLVGLLSTTAWAGIRFISQGESLFVGEFIETWLLHPPAVQLWFLRDLVVLVLIAPAIRWLAQSQLNWFAIPCLGLAWFFNLQFFPIVAGWYVLNLETTLFFVLGSAAVRHIPKIESLGNCTAKTMLGLSAAWTLMVGLRVWLRPDFDLWYTNQWGFIDLALHQGSILVGCLALFALSWRLRTSFTLGVSGASFFVYLVHEFPLRAVVNRIAGIVIPEAYTCWVVLPIVVAGSYTFALIASQYFPRVFKAITGGRCPAVQIETKSWRLRIPKIAPAK